MVEIIAVGISGHFQPIQAANKFAPAENLADKPFHRIERRLPVMIARFDLAAHAERVSRPRLMLAPTRP